MQKECSVPPARTSSKNQACFLSDFSNTRNNYLYVSVSACSLTGLHPSRGVGKGGGSSVWPFLHHAPPPSISSTFFPFLVPLFPLPSFQSCRAVKPCPTTAAGGLFLVHGFVTGIHSRSPLAIWHYQFCSLWQSLSP